MSSNRIKGQGIQVGDNFVLPIEQTKVTRQQEKVQQIIEETDAKAQQILSGAENKSLIIVEAANNEATRIIEEARKQAQKEYNTIRQQGYDEGFKKGEQDGLYKFQNDAAEGLKSLETLASSAFDIKQNIINSASRDIVDLVTVIADKVCHVQFNDKILYKLALDAIKLLHDKETITIIVSPKLVDNITQLAPAIKTAIPKLQTLKILEDSSLSPDGVIIETPDTRLDSRISSQISEIAENMLTGINNDLEQG